jgi:hypothetical protein
MMADDFQNHLARIRSAKERTSEIFSSLSPSTETAMASLSRAWEMLFDSICGSHDGTLGELKDISAVIQKLSTSHRKIQEIEMERLERLTAADLDGERRRLEDEREKFARGRLPDEILKTVEEQLRLL